MSAQEPELAYSKGEIRRAGDRIRAATARREEPLESDLAMLNAFRAWHQPMLETCQTELVKWFHDQLELDEKTVFITERVRPQKPAAQRR